MFLLSEGDEFGSGIGKCVPPTEVEPGEVVSLGADFGSEDEEFGGPDVILRGTIG
jgi:hypothetical protein